MSLSAPQPDPEHNEHPAIWDLVIADMKERDASGLEKYGTRLQPFNGRDALVDAYQEALDLVVYLRQAIAERDEALKKPKRYHITEGVLLRYDVSVYGENIPRMKNATYDEMVRYLDTVIRPDDVIIYSGEYYLPFTQTGEKYIRARDGCDTLCRS